MSPKIPPRFKIFEAICEMEIGGKYNAWAFKGAIADNMGVNYGPLQINVKGGSVGDYTRFYMPKDAVFLDFYKTPDGAKAMLAYFEAIHYRAAVRTCESREWAATAALIGILCDCQVQGGSITPTRAPRPENWLYWPTAEGWPEFGKYVKAQYAKDDATFAGLYFRCLSEAKNYGIATVSAIAELHPLSGRPNDPISKPNGIQYLSDQLSRRRLWSNGKSAVHGELLSLKDYGL
jgi:hypothetical protein